jgi:hypothetical protein
MFKPHLLPSCSFALTSLAVTPFGFAHGQVSLASAGATLTVQVFPGNEFSGSPSFGSGKQVAQRAQTDVFNFGNTNPPCQDPFGFLITSACPFSINQTKSPIDLATESVTFDNFVVSGCNPAYGTGRVTAGEFNLSGSGESTAISGGYHPSRDGTSTSTCTGDVIPKRGEPCSWRTLRTGLASDLYLSASFARQSELVGSSGTVTLATTVDDSYGNGTRARHWRGNATFMARAGVVGTYWIDIKFYNAISSTPVATVYRRGIATATPFGIALSGALQRPEFLSAVTVQSNDSNYCFQSNTRSASIPEVRVDEVIAFPAGTVRMTVDGRMRFGAMPFPIGPNGEVNEDLLNAVNGFDPTTGLPTNGTPSGYLPAPGSSFDLDGDGQFNCNDRVFLAISYAGGSRSVDDPQTSPFADLDLDGAVSVHEAQYLLSQLGSPCNCAANIADDAGNPLPSTGVNNGVTEGDYNAFFAGYFDALPYCDIADDSGTPYPSTGANNGVTEADYNVFFANYFDC